MSARHVFTLTVGIVASGCGGDSGPSAAGPIVRDSAGVQIVENVSPAWAEDEGWRVARDARVTIGVVHGSPGEQLFNVVGAWRLDDGRFVVANGGTRELRFFDQEGEYVWATGGQGEGPGEFADLQRLDLMRGDTLVAFDRSSRRISLFDPSGSLVRTLPVPTIAGRTWPTPRGTFADGSILVYSEEGYFPPAEGGMIVREPALFFRLDPRNETVDTIGEFPVRGYYVHVAGPAPIPFEPTPVAVAAGDAFYFGAARHFEIDVHAPSGELERSVRWLTENEPVRPDDIAEYRARILDPIEIDEVRIRAEATLREMFEDVTIPDTKPAYSNLIIDAVGNLWVADYRPSGEEAHRWTVFDFEGRLLGSVEMPKALGVYQIGTDFVVGRTTDEFGVERVVLHELIKPED